MKPTENAIEAGRRALKVSIADLARMLRSPYRTVQDWCSGARPYPGVAEVAVGLLVEKDRRVMERIVGRIGGGNGAHRS